MIDEMKSKGIILIKENGLYKKQIAELEKEIIYLKDMSP